MSLSREDLIAAVIRNHFNWYGDSQPNVLASEIEDALRHHSTVKALTDDEIDHIRTIVFPEQSHPDDIEWGCGVVKSSVTVADVIRVNQ
jgi:hypothetical protein